jgi:hypothetical protein
MCEGKEPERYVRSSLFALRRCPVYHALMRSVVVHLRDTTESEVAAFLQQAYPSQQGPTWIAQASGDACLYIDFHPCSPSATPPEEWQAIVREFGGAPAVSVIADVSGRHPGGDQVREFVTRLLARFSGAATDDYSKHMWSLHEITSGHRAENHPFFDYNGS